MKKQLLFFGFLLSFSFASLSQVDESSKIQHFEKRAFNLKMNFVASQETDKYDIVYHRIYWEIDPGIAEISGTVTSYFKPTITSLSSIYFDLIDTLYVDSVKQSGTLLKYTHINNLVNITLKSPVPKGILDSLTVFYHGQPQSITGFGSFETSIHNNAPILWTLSEPYGAREWWPCKQSLTDKIDSIDIYVKTPQNYKVGSNGKLMFERIEGDKKLTFWKHRYPIAAYLVAIAVTNYDTYIQYAKVNDTDSVEILNYIYPEKLSSIKAQLAVTIDAIELFSKMFIPYPFYKEKYGHAQFGWGGGMEHQTMGFLVDFRESLIIHELAHQWFGDHVTCASWHDIWMNEGFAVFCEYVAEEHMHPEAWIDWKKARMDIVLQNPANKSVYVQDTTDINRIFDGTFTYQKGGLILQMLREQIGDDAFFKGMHDLLTDPKTAGGFASAEDFRAIMENAADTNLTTYFDNWYYGKGYPDYTINWQQNFDREVSITISQQTTDISVPFFAMRVPVLLKGNGQEKLVKLYNTTNNQNFKIKTDFIVSDIVFDPYYNILAPHPATIIFGVDETPVEKHILIMPNPTKNTLTVKAWKDTSIQKFDIIDNSGKEVLKTTSPENTKHLEINLSPYPNGLYYIRVETNEGLFVRKFIKSN